MASESDRQASPPGPIPPPRMTEIANEACGSTFASVTSYSHAQTSSWNTSIINKILQSVIEASSTPTSPPLYKFAVTSTIIQHTTPISPLQDPDRPLSAGPPQPEGPEQNVRADYPPASPSTPPQPIARRGMHSATGAYWNNATDGMWSYKYENSEAKGFDVVISVVWVSVS